MLFYRTIKYSSKHNHPTHEMFWAVLNLLIYRQFDQHISFFDKTGCLTCMYIILFNGFRFIS